MRPPAPRGGLRGGPLSGLLAPVRDASATAVAAGLVAALVGLSGPFALVVQATAAAHLDPARAASWVWAVMVGSGVSGLVLSLATRTPVVVAFSTPGAALLIASVGGFRFSDAVGAFVVASAAACVLGATGWFGRLLALVPEALTAALLAGVLLPFVVAGARAVTSAPVAAGAVVAAFVVGRRVADRYAVLLALVAGVVAVAATGGAGHLPLGLRLTAPVLTRPTFDVRALLGLALPLLLVTMAAQNAPGLAVLRAAGYAPRDRLLVGSVSLVSTLLAPFGGHATNLAALTASLCTGEGAHADPRRRYVAAVTCALANLAAGAGAGWLISAFTALPTAMIAALAAVALLAPLGGALAGALAGTRATTTAALVTLAVTASGVVVAGIGSAFWGLLVGVGAWLVLRGPRAPAAQATADPGARVR